MKPRKPFGRKATNDVSHDLGAFLCEASEMSIAYSKIRIFGIQDNMDSLSYLEEILDELRYHCYET